MSVVRKTCKTFGITIVLFSNSSITISMTINVFMCDLNIRSIDTFSTEKFLNVQRPRRDGYPRQMPQSPHLCSVCVCVCVYIYYEKRRNKRTHRISVFSFFIPRRYRVKRDVTSCRRHIGFPRSVLRLALR